MWKHDQFRDQYIEQFDFPYCEEVSKYEKQAKIGQVSDGTFTKTVNVLHTRAPLERCSKHGTGRTNTKWVKWTWINIRATRESLCTYIFQENIYAGFCWLDDPWPKLFRLLRWRKCWWKMKRRVFQSRHSGFLTIKYFCPCQWHHDWDFFLFQSNNLHLWYIYCWI